MTPSLARLEVGDDPQLWTDLGFDVVDGECRLGEVEVALTGEGGGIRGWTWRDTASAGFGPIPTATTTDPAPARGAVHPNRAERLFYVVLMAPSWQEAADACRASGIDPGEPAGMGRSGRTLRSLADGGDVEIEVIGPAERDPDRAWDLWGSIVLVDDIDATARYLGDRLRPTKPAVQPGRRIATLDQSAGSEVALAFMSHEDSRGD